MEAWTNTVLRALQTGCQQGSGGANGRQSPRPLADRELSRSEHCFAERLLCSAWASAAGRTLLAISAEPPYADPHVRWCGRGEWATTPPMPIWGRLDTAKRGNVHDHFDEAAFDARGD